MAKNFVTKEIGSKDFHIRSNQYELREAVRGKLKTV